VKKEWKKTEDTMIMFMQNPEKMFAVNKMIDEMSEDQLKEIVDKHLKSKEE